MRLLHNFYDRDFIENSNKYLLLSPFEIESIYLHSDDNNNNNNNNNSFIIPSIPSHRQGLLSRISRTFIQEPNDSKYRFWLCSSLEAFLRGSNRNHQRLIAETGAIKHLIEHIFATRSSKTSNNLQTAFDLLGEIIKFNHQTLEIFDKSLNDAEFEELLDIIMTNLIDSNVFLRSLFLSFDPFLIPGLSKEEEEGGGGGEEEEANTKVPEANKDKDKNHSSSISYLTDSWIQFNPRVSSQRAIDLFKSQGKLPILFEIN